MPGNSVNDNAACSTQIGNAHPPSCNHDKSCPPSHDAAMQKLKPYPGATPYDALRHITCSVIAKHDLQLSKPRDGTHLARSNMQEASSGYSKHCPNKGSNAEQYGNAGRAPANRPNPLPDWQPSQNPGYRDSSTRQYQCLAEWRQLPSRVNRRDPPYGSLNQFSRRET